MIGFLQGTVLEVFPHKIILMTSGGVGYDVFPSMNLLGNSQKGGNASFPVFTVVKENELSLYGFHSLDEKALFEKVLSISGVGPKMALKIVSTSVSEFLNAVESGDEAFICKIPGIGKKMAQKIIVELQGKIDLSSHATTVDKTLNPQKEEAMEALKNLGYDKPTIQKVLDSAPEGSSTEDLVKYFLSR